jgi:hypothetical protein
MYDLSLYTNYAVRLAFVPSSSVLLIGYQPVYVECRTIGYGVFLVSFFICGREGFVSCGDIIEKGPYDTTSEIAGKLDSRTNVTY